MAAICFQLVTICEATRYVQIWTLLQRITWRYYLSNLYLFAEIMPKTFCRIEWGKSYAPGTRTLLQTFITVTSLETYILVNSNTMILYRIQMHGNYCMCIREGQEVRIPVGSGLEFRCVRACVHACMHACAYVSTSVAIFPYVVGLKCTSCRLLFSPLYVK